MYKKILVPLEVSNTDRVIIDHIKQLAKAMQSNVTLLHIATGVPAKYSGANAAGEEVEQDKEYLNKIKCEFEDEGISANAELGYGDPPREIVKWIEKNQCDLVAMSTHGHRFLAHLVFGETASHVQHRTGVPVLLIRAR